MPLFSILQQIYGYEDLHMLQSRLPMVSVFAAHMEQPLLVSCCETLAMIILFFSPLCRIIMESHFRAPQQLSPTETAASPTTPTQVKLLCARLA